MSVHNRKESIILLVGDIALFYTSLWLALFLRYAEIPSKDLWMTHIEPFSIIFLISIIVFFVAGLYEKHTLILKSKLPSTILNAQAVNTLLAVLLFYLVPYFNIAPKTNLFIYLVISFIFVTSWRLNGQEAVTPLKREKGMLIGLGKEMREIYEEVNNNSRYGFSFVSSLDLSEVEGIDFQEEIVGRIYSEDVDVIVIDIQNNLTNPILPHLYNLLFSNVRFLDLHKVYEEIFDRVPLSLVKYNWFLENISSTSRKTHDLFKRAMDIFISLVFGVISLLFYPLIALAIVIEDGSPVFYKQERVGQRNKRISIVKFRTMKVIRDEQATKDEEMRITKVGNILRKTRLDELPQLWNVLFGDISLIGPRPEVPNLVKHYEKEVSFYNVRHLIKPGISGWAQMYHDEPAKYLKADEDSTRVKLSYDLYYLKNRSIILDIKIALKTLKVFFMRAGK